MPNKSDFVPPVGSIGMTPTTYIDFVADLDKAKWDDPNPQASGPSATKGPFKKTLRKGGFAKANVAEASAGNEIIGIGVKALEAGAEYQYGIHNSAGVNLTVAKVEGALGPVAVSAGLSADTSVYAGIDGVGFSLLGFGIHVGPKMGISTPFASASVSCSIM